MARLEFAILQYLEGNVRIVLQRDEKQVLERLQTRVQEDLIGFDNKKKEQVRSSIEHAFNELVQEFKDETIRIV